MKSTTYQQRLLEANGFDPKTPIVGHIKIGLLGMGGYFSQIFQGGHNYIHYENGKYFHIEIARHVPVEQDGYGIFMNADVIIQLVNGDVGEMMLSPLYAIGNVLSLYRYPKNIQQWLLGVAAKRNNIHNGALNKNSPYVFKQLQTFSSYNLHCPNLTVPESTLKWWVLKPDNDAMSKNVCFLDGSRANLITILNLFRGHSNDVSYKEAMETITTLQSKDILKLKRNANNKDYEFKKYFGGHIVAQERICDFEEYRLIKHMDGKIHILDRPHLEHEELPSNGDIHYTDIIGVWTHQHGFNAVAEKVHDFFKSSEFDQFMNLFLEHSAFQFTTGSIDLFITKNNEYGVFEFQPQFGVMDVPLSVMQEYRQSFFSYILTQFNRSK